MKGISFFMGFVISCLVCLGCKDKGDKKERESKVVETADWVEFKARGFRLLHPPTWEVRKDSFPGKQPAYSLYRKSREPEMDFPLGLHEQPDLAFMTVCPSGLGTELPSGTTVRFAGLEEDYLDLPIVPDSAKSKAFLLSDGTPWGFFLVPGNPPPHWTENGFIFLQYGIRNYRGTCFDRDTDEKKDMKMCDPLGGDRFVREGQVLESSRDILNEILTSLHLSKGGAFLVKPVVSSLKEGTVISSPLQVRGRAPGNWFFEATFPLELRTSDGHVLSRGKADAQGSWMTTDLVSFTAEMDFRPTKDLGEGLLILRKANPSGLPENADSLLVNVKF